MTVSLRVREIVKINTLGISFQTWTLLKIIHVMWPSFNQSDVFNLWMGCIMFNIGMKRFWGPLSASMAFFFFKMLCHYRPKHNTSILGGGGKHFKLYPTLKMDVISYRISTCAKAFQLHLFVVARMSFCDLTTAHTFHSLVQHKIGCDVTSIFKVG